jgi:hypothetical protein
MDAGGWYSSYHLSQWPPAKANCRAGSRNWIMKCQPSSTDSTTQSTKPLTRWLTCSPSPVGLQRTRNVSSIVNPTVAPYSLLSVTVSELPVLPVVIGRCTVQTSWIPNPKDIFSRPAAQKPVIVPASEEGAITVCMRYFEGPMATLKR